jgi:selenocysteine-specific elongation factor
LPVERLAVDLNVREAVLVDLLHRKRKSGLISAATATRFYPRESLARLAASAARLADDSESGEFSAAQYRDALRTGRTVAIQILELFDRMGVTLRRGDLRRMSPDFAAIVGAGAPMPVAAPRPPAPAARMTSAEPNRLGADRRTP